MQIDIKKTIKKSGLNLKDVAETLGMTREGLYYHIKRGNSVEVSTLERIAQVIGCKVDDFFYTDEGEQESSFHCPHCGGKITISK